MEFTIRDRLLLLNILPKEGDIESLRITRGLLEELSFSEEEHEEFQIARNGDGTITWNEEAAHTKEVTLGKKAEAIIGEALTKLNNAKKLGMAYIDLYEKFVEDEE